MPEFPFHTVVRVKKIVQVFQKFPTTTVAYILLTPPSPYFFTTTPIPNSRN
jgi:hypothetical protein